jgi:MOB kinase activator 1
LGLICILLINYSGNNTIKMKSNKKIDIENENKNLNPGNLNLAVKQPLGDSINEWLSVNSKFLILNIIAVEFYGTTNLIFGCISEFCTDSTCACMGAGEY